VPDAATRIHSVPVGPLSIERFGPLIGARAMAAASAVSERLRGRFAGRVVWNVNSTAVGGGVAEMLRPLLGYSRGLGIDARWVVIGGDAEFFRITKRIHHALHGSRGDGSPLGEAERSAYEATLEANARELCAVVTPGDIVILHDPQTLGLAPPLAASGARLIWRCHIGHDSPNAEVDAGWEFLRRHLEAVPATVFSRAAYVPAYFGRGKSRVIAPSIDAFSPKNQELDERAVRTILVHAGLVEGPLPDPADHGFTRADGTPGRVHRRADIVRLGRPAAWDTPLVVQVSRWDPLKDMIGVMEGFTRIVDGSAPLGAELVLAGPNVKAIADDPEGARVFDEVVAAWRALPHGLRDRVHLASLPTADVDENAAIVNALQRHAAVVVQKSLHEGFGLTVTEAMWKGRPLLASAVGGIQDQVVNEQHGLLLEDPRDLDAFAASLRRLLEDRALAQRLGRNARERVREEYLGVRHLLQYARLLEEVDEASSS
jgi:trehalose synthase